MTIPAVEVCHLSYVYPDGRAALTDISLNIGRGETVGIIGPNGAGKTTFILHLNGCIPSQNTIRIMGVDMNRETIRSLRSTVGLVFQNPDDQLFSPTVFDDVAFGPLNFGLPEVRVRECVTAALRQVGMEGYERATPHHLSSGEKKRIAIATVLALPCEIMALDEPTSNLDARARRNLIALLQRLPMTKIMVSHDLDMVASLCSRVVVMDRGAIAADGSVNAIFGDRALMAEFAFTPPSVAHNV